MADLREVLRNLLTATKWVEHERCVACGKSMRAHPCWKYYGGEPCMLNRGHPDDHCFIMSGMTWRDDECSDPGHPKECGAPTGAKSLFSGCKLPPNHTGPHEGEQPGHAPDCAYVAAKQALGEGP